MLLNERGDLEGAEPLFREELDACAKRCGMDHKETQGSAKNLIKLLQTMGRDSEAAQLASEFKC